ncbi:MAG: hypothetical protein HY432_01040 [Candidatus Liptonbacteria bacterium]|nr:hypothetical protein [Candidatus Liptonbacteria bacterium]
MAGFKGEKSEGELNESEKWPVDANFREHMLDVDVGNSLMHALISAQIGNTEDIQKLQAYEEYLREKSSASATPDLYYDYVMEKSNPVLVEKYNSRIRAFNEELPEIKRQKNRQRVEDFVNEMIELLETKRGGD